jgi:hypothetical protein
MTVTRLIELALNDIGVTNPTPEEIEVAWDHLNMIVSNFDWWKPGDQPIDRFATVTETIQLPAYYLEVFENLLAAREAPSYGTPMTTIQALEIRAKMLTDRLIYKRQGAGNSIPATSTVV